MYPKKSGSSAVVDVLQYGEKDPKNGLSLLQAPGNDPVAASALASSDCQLVLFTTGRGTPFGSYVPTLKVATNTTLFDRKGHWMDFQCWRTTEKEPHGKHFRTLLLQKSLLLLVVKKLEMSRMM